jgi:SpoIID/LytB domain protein
VRALLLLLVAGLARAEDLSPSDRRGLLTSSQFAFGRDGTPLVRVRLREGVREVSLFSPGGLVLLPDGQGSAEVRGTRSWRIRLVEGHAARLAWWAESERAPSSKAAELRERARAAPPGARKTRVFDVGSVFAIGGETLDRRQALLATGPFASEAEAAAVPASTGVHVEVLEPARGTLEAESPEIGTVVSNQDMLWFSAAGPSRIFTDDGRSYFGDVYVAIDRNGTLAVVNSVPEDRLLEGLVPSEMYASAPAEALKAQAVAARGELLAKIGQRHFGDPYLLCSEQHCQVYGGAGKEDPRTTEAVRATRGWVLLDAQGGLVDTVYSACCGGHTEDNDRVWPGPADPTLRGQADGAGPSRLSEATLRDFLAHPPATFCSHADGRFRWQSRIDAATLGAGLGVGELQDLRVLERGSSGRALAVRADGSTGDTVVRGELRIRKLLGDLKSSLFVVDHDGRDFVFSGGGFGHGVGLCQEGAVGMARAGRDFRAILLHYYPGSRLVRLY